MRGNNRYEELTEKNVQSICSQFHLVWLNFLWIRYQRQDLDLLYLLDLLSVLLVV